MDPTSTKCQSKVQASYESIFRLGTIHVTVLLERSTLSEAFKDSVT